MTGKTRSGLERIVTGDAVPFKTERVGLLTHPAAITSDGRHAAHALGERRHPDLRRAAPRHRPRGGGPAGRRRDRPVRAARRLAGLLKFRDEHFDLLAGSDALRAALNKGRTPEEILAGWR